MAELNKESKIYTIFAGIVLIWGLIAVIAASGGRSFSQWLLYFGGGLIFGLLTLIVGVLILVRGLSRKEAIGKIFPRAFLIQLLLLVIVFFGVGFNLALQTRFALSRGSFQSVAEQAKAGKAVETPCWVGLFKVNKVDKAGSAVRFVISEVGPDDKVIVFSPGGKPPVFKEYVTEQLAGSWWLWTRSW